MHGVVAAVVSGAGVVAEQVDPTVQPVRQSFYVFVFLAVATVLLLLSMLRHMRRAHSNLGTTPADTQVPAGADAPAADLPARSEDDAR